MKSLWVLSAILLFIGFCIFLYSAVPVTVKEPYMKSVTQTKDTVVQDGTISALSSFYYKSYSFKQGDKISITASIDEGTLSVSVDELLSGEIVSRENVQSVNLDVTVPKDSLYTISVKRYKESAFVFYFEKTNANIKITTRTTEQGFVTAYKDVITYPYKNLETAGIAIMLAGIGAGVLSVAQNKGKGQDFQKNANEIV